VRLTVATWNINSVRLRIDLVARFLREQAPHVLCLQETKCRDSEFPLAAFHKLGYPYAALNGQKGYHGVAIASKLPLTIIDRRSFCEKGDARHIAVTLTPGDAHGRAIALHNFYVPAGGDEPDPVANPKFAHKLAFLDEMRERRDLKPGTGECAILVGDLNVAPLETDVWSHKQLLDVGSHTPVEVARLKRLGDSAGFIDAVRHFIPPEQRLYSWWSYRARDWTASDRGRRLDHIWVTPPIAGMLGGAAVFKAARGWPDASDHVPVIVTIGS
jgi:exodeoxyribonuclease III